jgi:hypothetical protein
MLLCVLNAHNYTIIYEYLLLDLLNGNKSAFTAKYTQPTQIIRNINIIAVSSLRKLFHKHNYSR